MFDNAFMFDGGIYRPGAVVLVCFIFSAAWFVLCTAFYTNGVFFGVLSGGYASALAFGVIRLGWRMSLIYLPVSVWNHVLGRLDSLGFTALSGLKPDMPAAAENGLYVKLGFYAFCGLVSLIFVSCLYNKVKAVPVIITAGIVMTLTFTYNLLTDNIGFLLTLASGFGILVLLYYSAFTKEKAEKKKPEKGAAFRFRRRSLSKISAAGLSGFVALAIILGVGAYPAIRIHEPAPKLMFLDRMIEEAREWFLRDLIGEDQGVSDYEAAKKSSAPTPREFGEVRVLTLTSGYPSALYMRAWVSDHYSADKWTASSAPANGANIVPEEITELFYLIVDIDANILSDVNMAETDSIDRGFIKEFITVKSEALSGATGVLASRFSTSYGITDPGMNREYEKGYHLNEGVGTVNLNMKNAEYGTVAYSPTYKRLDLSRLDDDMWIYDNVLPCIKYYANRRINSEKPDKTDAPDADAWLNTEKELIADAAKKKGIKIPDGCIINRLSDMSDTELSSLVSKLAEVEKYEDYVYDNCASAPWSDGELLKKISYEAFGGSAGDGRPSEIFNCAWNTARYLAKTCRYSLRPEGYNGSGSYVSQFLTTAKNGYCVQYATAGALILRAAGIPTRYVDGYLASEFYQYGSRYKSTVLDSNSHAWIEAYVRGYGWMTFEMTAPMLNGIYSSPTQSTDVTDESVHLETGGSDTEIFVTFSDGDTSEAVTEPPETTEMLTDTDGPDDPGTVTARVSSRVFLILGIMVLCVLIVSSAIYIFIKQTTERANERLDMLKKAAAGNTTDPEKDIKAIAEYTFYLLERIGYKRGRTELMSDFVKRVDRIALTEKSFVPAAHAIQKNSFGRCADAKDCKDAAEYALYIRALVKRRMPRAERFWYYKVLKRI